MAAQLASEVPTITGFLRMESIKDENGREITLSYWQTTAGILAWREQLNHRRAKAQFHQWYDTYEVQFFQVQAWNPS